MEDDITFVLNMIDYVRQLIGGYSTGAAIVSTQVMTSRTSASSQVTLTNAGYIEVLFYKLYNIPIPRNNGSIDYADPRVSDLQIALTAWLTQNGLDSSFN
jgi:hypothetical protein